jgi:hypothetical protein
MKIVTSSYRVISIEGEYSEGIWFPKWDVFKEVSVFGIYLYGEIINKEAFSDKKDAEDFLKMIEDGRR